MDRIVGSAVLEVFPVDDSDLADTLRRRLEAASVSGDLSEFDWLVRRAAASIKARLLGRSIADLDPAVRCGQARYRIGDGLWYPGFNRRGEPVSDLLSIEWPRRSGRERLIAVSLTALTHGAGHEPSELRSIIDRLDSLTGAEPTPEDRRHRAGLPVLPTGLETAAWYEHPLAL